MASGDESALAALYDRWATRVHSVAFWILQDADEAEDVVEETFWQAWRSAARYDERRSAGSTWLVTIARCRALDRLRQRRRMDERLAAASAAGELREAGAADPAETPDRQAEQSDRAGGLAEALATLTPEQRHAIELAFFNGLSHAEIAARTALPIGTVKTRIRLAMQKLRKWLTPLHEESFERHADALGGAGDAAGGGIGGSGAG